MAVGAVDFGRHDDRSNEALRGPGSGRRRAA
jgi:hypothetical protein